MNSAPTFFDTSVFPSSVAYIKRRWASDFTGIRAPHDGTVRQTRVGSGTGRCVARAARLAGVPSPQSSALGSDSGALSSSSGTDGPPETIQSSGGHGSRDLAPYQPRLPRRKWPAVPRSAGCSRTNVSHERNDPPSPTNRARPSRSGSRWPDASSQPSLAHQREQASPSG